MFALNAMLYTDDDIQSRKVDLNLEPTSTDTANVTISGSANIDSFIKDLPKSIFSCIISMVLNYLIGLLLIIPKLTESAINSALVTINPLIIPVI